MQDVSPDPGSGGGGEGYEGHPGKLLPQRVELLVVWPEVVTPLGHTVGLVNNKPGEELAAVERGQGIQSLLTGGQPLWSEVEEAGEARASPEPGVHLGVAALVIPRVVLVPRDGPGPPG